MSHRSSRPRRRADRPCETPAKVRNAAVLPLGALAAGFGFAGFAMAQTAPAASAAPASAPAAEVAPAAPAEAGSALPVVRTRAQGDASGKDSLRTTTTNIGRGTQQLRDIPQSITVVTERLIDDRNLDTMKDVLRNTAGVTFQAAEGAEEDIRLRGFSLQGTGDIFIDGMRDPAFYDRDTFNNDRIELLRGSASMLFGRGSTGGAVNQVSKLPRQINQNEAAVTLGNHNYRRATGDFNLVTGDESALRLNVMRTKADNNGSGSSIDKSGFAAAFRWGIGTRDEFLASFYYLDNQNGINYGIPWIKPTASATTAQNTVIPGLSPEAYYGMASDRSDGGARMLTLSHIHRFSGTTELRTQVRKGEFKRDLRASAIRLCTNNAQNSNPSCPSVTPALDTFSQSTIFTRGSNFKIQDADTLYFQSDLSSAFDALGVRHELLAGVDATREAKSVYTPRSAAQGGVDLVKPTTTAGTPNDGASVNEDSRILRDNNNFVAKGYGAFVQDVVQVAPAWKVVGGLRYDNVDGNYNQYNLAAGVPGPITTVNYSQRISAWSKRFGLLYQPTPLQSFHFSWGTSFNTSGDTYSYNTQNANTPPEESENLELGAKLDTEDRRFTSRFALFRTTKKNERNTDVDTAATRLLLSGKRHATGFEADLTGRLTPKWEVFGSYMWLFDAKVDAAAGCGNLPVNQCLQGTVGNRVGDRPGLSPKHSGTIWSTYQVLPRLRVGAGINFRSKQAPADVTAPAWNAPGFATMDLMAEYRFTENLSLKGNIINVGDKYYADALYRGHYVPGAGRLVQASLIARF